MPNSALNAIFFLFAAALFGVGMIKTLGDFAGWGMVYWATVMLIDGFTELEVEQ